MVAKGDFTMKNKGGGCPHCGQRKTLVRFADSANKKYPIDTAEHIKASWDAIHKQKTVDKYSNVQMQEMEEKIINAWVRHVNIEGPPVRK